jgi:hypothetical protein
MMGAIFAGALSTWLAGVFHRLVARVLVLLGRMPAAVPGPPALSPWLAGSTHRWHTNPIFATSRDRVDGHSARVAILILQFWPAASAELLKSAIIHDLGENSVGDLASPVKRKNPDLYAELEALEVAAIEAMGFDVPGLILSPREAAVLHLCDGLDAYLWAVFHRPEYVRSREAWRVMFARLKSCAADLGLTEKFNEIVEGVCDGKF